MTTSHGPSVRHRCDNRAAVPAVLDLGPDKADHAVKAARTPYVGVTRARSKLVVVGDPDVAGAYGLQELAGHLRGNGCVGLAQRGFQSTEGIVRGRTNVWVLAVCVLLAACIEATPDAASESPPPAVATATPAPAPAGSVVDQPRRLLTRINDLPVAVAMPTGYDRDLFDHWVDDDGDCQDTRHEVLAVESHTEVSGCRIEVGAWQSYYDGLAWTASSDLDVDHMVPLAEAWGSGASGWSADTRRRFANDVDDDRSLVAVTDNVNQAKGDRDPAEWLPDQQVCRYIGEWVAVKTRWSLTVDQAERDALLAAAGDCPDQLIDVSLAVIEMGPASPTRPDVEPDGCVDINRDDDLAELQRIVHIGAERAGDVLANRPYDSLGQLQRIDGIGASRVDDIRDQGLAAVAC